MIDSSLRSTVVDILDEVLTPIRQVELDAILTARHSVALSEVQFAEILASERQRFATGSSGEPLLLPGLQVPGAAGDSAYMTRSDWAVKMRLTGETLESSRSLLMIRWMCDQLDVAKQAGSSTCAVLEREIHRASALIPVDVIEEYKAEMEDVEEADLIIEVFRNSAEDLASECRRKIRDVVDSATVEFSRLSPEKLAFGF